MDSVTVWLVGAMLAQGALAIGLMFYLGTIRVPMIVRGDVRMRDIATSRSGWPEHEQKVANAVDNQFQLPALFYVACIISVFIGPTWFDLLFAWAFVVTRYIHAVIHVTDNNVVRRFWVFTTGLIILTLFWLALAIQLVAVSTLFSRGFA